MKKFLVLYHSPISNQEQMKKATPELMKAAMDGWMKWAGKAGKALVDMGAPLGDSGWIKGTPRVGHLGGYSMVQTDSIDAAKKLFDGHPHFELPGASIQVVEIMPTPGK